MKTDLSLLGQLCYFFHEEVREIGRKAIFVMDIQNDFVGYPARMPVAKHHIAPMMDAIHLVLEKVDPAEFEIVYIANEFERKNLISNLFRKFAAMKGQQGAKLYSGLRIVNDNYFTKNKANAFSNPNLTCFLQNKEIDEIIITGLFAEGCVFYTAMAAKKRGFKVTILKDAVASANDIKMEKALRQLRDYGISTELTNDYLCFSNVISCENGDFKGGT